MPKLVARILLALLVIPGAVFVWIVSFEVLDSTPIDTERCEWYASGLCSAFTMIYWTLVWRRDVRWTTRQVTTSILSVVGAGLFGLVLQYLLEEFNVYRSTEAATLGMLTVWLVATILLWRDPTVRPIAGPEEIVCPACGYNLAGLSEIRCPECGSRFTLDQLLARQPGRETATEASEIGR
jgi:DNA-directed RNA polymerase subunit RPC12/RpoP